jgi:hypothetical protein
MSYYLAGNFANEFDGNQSATSVVSFSNLSAMYDFNATMSQSFMAILVIGAVNNLLWLLCMKIFDLSSRGLVFKRVVAARSKAKLIVAAGIRAAKTNFNNANAAVNGSGSSMDGFHGRGSIGMSSLSSGSSNVFTYANAEEDAYMELESGSTHSPTFKATSASTSTAANPTLNANVSAGSFINQGSTFASASSSNAPSRTASLESPALARVPTSESLFLQRTASNNKLLAPTPSSFMTMGSSSYDSGFNGPGTPSSPVVIASTASVNYNFNSTPPSLATAGSMSYSQTVLPTDATGSFGRSSLSMSPTHATQQVHISPFLSRLSNASVASGSPRGSSMLLHSTGSSNNLLSTSTVPVTGKPSARSSSGDNLETLIEETGSPNSDKARESLLALEGTETEV